MSPKQSPQINSRFSNIVSAARAACGAIPPAFPLDSTVAVNPFLGQSAMDLPTTAALLERVGGVRLTQPKSAYKEALASGVVSDDDLAAALGACASPLKPTGVPALKIWLAQPRNAPEALATIADLSARATGVNWPASIARTLGLWAAGRFDRGQAFWSPAPAQSAYASWREWAMNDLTPEIAGLTGFCAHVASAPDTVERMILRAADRLGVCEAAAESVFHRLLMDMGGWAQHARWLQWEAERADATDDTILDLLAVRLAWEEALLEHAPEVKSEWESVLAIHRTEAAPSPDHVAEAIWQDALERANQRKLAAAITGGQTPDARPTAQVAFCIDVRSEVFRRALEGVNPSIATIGFAGFYGLPVAHRAHGTDDVQAHLPVLLRPSMFACSHVEPDAERKTRVTSRATRAWGRFRQAAVSSFAFVEAAGLAYGGKLLKDSLFAGGVSTPESPRPRFQKALSAEQKGQVGAAVLKAMSATSQFARLFVLLGHGAKVTNNPHESAYHCGACGGQTGEVSARLLADLLNDPETRAALRHQGVVIPDDTLFLAGLHETTTDNVVLYDVPQHGDHLQDIAQLRKNLEQAGALAREERSIRLPQANAANVASRAWNWAQVRPEWGLAGCSAFIAAPRATTARAQLNGRSFLHSYDWREDAGFATLELILTAPVVVASWISLQYYGSSVAPDAFGGGNKLIHNVVGGLGVVEGNGGSLRAGLPWQAVHNGERLAHDPLRLSVYVEAPKAAIIEIIAKHDTLRNLFDNGWLHLFQIEDGAVSARYRPGLSWEGEPLRTAA